MSNTNQIDHQYEIAVAAFRNAFGSGIIHQNEPWMYMYSDSHHDYFKHRETRQYITCLKEVKTSDRQIQIVPDEIGRHWARLREASPAILHKGETP